jgi:hypothetical protein
MHGFLNVFVTAALVHNGVADVNPLDVLIGDSAALYRLDESGLRWDAHFLTNDQLFDTRRHFALSFGSCSFQEPIDDLKGLALL